MSEVLRGQVALVTGGSRGIGRQVASALAEAGAEVLLTSRTPEAGRAAAEEIRSSGGKARDVVLDITDDAAVETVVKELLGNYGTIPLLVNNAGITRDGLLLRMKKVDWDVVIETNLSGTYRLCRALVPSMIRSEPRNRTARPCLSKLPPKPVSIPGARRRRAAAWACLQG